MLSGVMVSFKVGRVGAKRASYLVLQFQVGLHFSCQRLVRAELGSPRLT